MTNVLYLPVRLATSLAVRQCDPMCGYSRDFADWLRSWGAAETTIRVRLRVCAAFARDHDPLTATAAEVTAWLARPGLSAWTRSSYYGHLHSLFDWMRRAGVRPDDPTIDLRAPRRPAQKPRPLTPTEAARALAAADETVRSWLMLGLFAGLRAFEIAKVRGEDVSQQAIFVRGKGGKDAMIPTHPALWDLACSMPRVGWWYPSPHHDKEHVCTATVIRRTTALFAGLGIEGSTHRARHAYCTNLMRAGVSLRVVQELARHSSLSTTAGYLAVDEDERRTAIGLLSA